MADYEDFDEYPEIIIFTKSWWYRIFHINEWIFPTTYEIDGYTFEESKRHFPLFWRKEYFKTTRSIKSVYLKKGFFYSSIEAEIWENEDEKISFNGINNNIALEVKESLEDLLMKAKEVTLRR